MKKPVYASVFIILAAVLVLQATMPFAVARALEKSLGSSFAAETAQVDVKAYPAVKLLAGRADILTIKMKNFCLQDVPVSDLRLEVEDPRILWKTLLEKGEFQLGSSRRVVAHLFISWEEINEYLRADVEGVVDNLKLSSRGDNIVLDGTVNIFNQSVEFVLEGNLEKEKSGLVFQPRRIVQTEPGFMKEFMGDRRLQQFSLYFPLPAAYEKLQLEEITISPEGVTIYALGTGLDWQGNNSSGGCYAFYENEVVRGAE